MQKSEFIQVINKFILPIFNGSEIAGEEPSTLRDAVVAGGASGVVLCKSLKTDDYRMIIRRDQPFKKVELNLIKAVLDEILRVTRFKITEPAYKKSLLEHALEKAICKSIARNNYKTLLDLTHELSLWGAKTYEGNNPSFAFVISSKNKNTVKDTNLHFSKFLSQDFSAPLSDGVNSYINLDSEGYIMGYMKTPKNSNYNTFAPFKLINMAGVCKKGKVGISLLTNGDIILFNGQEMVFSKSRGQWNTYNHEEIYQKITDRNKDPLGNLAKSIYLAAIDVSFARTGGCIVCVKRDQEENVLKHIDTSDILMDKYLTLNKKQELPQISLLEMETNLNEVPLKSETVTFEKNIKNSSIRKILENRKFQDIDRELRLHLLSIDGATVIDSEGEIIAVGAIIQIDAGSTGGGRLAASKTLCKYGIAIKISTDGTIQGFGYDKQKQKPKPIFTI